MATSGMTGVIEPKDVPLDYTVLKNPEQLETPTVKVIAEEDDERPTRAVEFHAKVQLHHRSPIQFSREFVSPFNPHFNTSN